MDGKLLMKLEKDFCKEVDLVLKETSLLASQDNTEKAFELLGVIEKQTRVGAGKNNVCFI